MTIGEFLGTERLDEGFEIFLGEIEFLYWRHRSSPARIRPLRGLR